jgi:hypothetical protein
VALDGAEVIAVVEGAQAAAGITARRNGHPRQAPFALLVARVEEERLVEARDEIGTAAEQLVVHGHRADDSAGAAAAGPAQAEQADHVGEVAMIGDVGGGAIAADEGIRSVLAGIDDGRVAGRMSWSAAKR